MDTTPHYPVGLFDCFTDCSLCMYGIFFPQCLNAENLAHLRHENCAPEHLCCSFSPFWTRQEMKRQTHIPYDFIGDAAVFVFCSPCGIIQDAYTIRNGTP